MKCVMQAANEMKTELVTSTMEKLSEMKYSDENSNGMEFSGETEKWDVKMKSVM